MAGTIQDISRLELEQVIRFVSDTIDEITRKGISDVGIVSFIYYPIIVFVLFQKAWSKFVELKTSTALPVDRFGDSTLVSTVNHFFKAGQAVGVAVVTKFNTYPFTSHFMSNCRCCTGTQE